MITNRSHNSGHKKLADSIIIAQEGDTMRTIGAWIGNKVDNISVWSNTINKIHERLKRWNRGHQSVQGKKHIIQMIVGGMTQYLTTVQGMPKEIERNIIRTVI